jgi:hypothetical protein
MRARPSMEGVERKGSRNGRASPIRQHHPLVDLWRQRRVGQRELKLPTELVCAVPHGYRNEAGHSFCLPDCLTKAWQQILGVTDCAAGSSDSLYCMPQANTPTLNKRRAKLSAGVVRILFEVASICHLCRTCYWRNQPKQQNYRPTMGQRARSPAFTR